MFSILIGGTCFLGVLIFVAGFLVGENYAIKVINEHQKSSDIPAASMSSDSNAPAKSSDPEKGRPVLPVNPENPALPSVPKAPKSLLFKG
jgi:hypothetical protein